jgi:outer membrane biosynthesis protein TonB
MGLAYGGGKMKLPGWKYPVVVDLNGMEIPETVPLLLNHENRTSSRVGMIGAKIEDNSLVIDGEIVAKGEQTDGIVEQAKAGADWQLSIGAEVRKSELIKGKRMINGQEVSGPFYHIQESQLREVSIVAVAADISTRMQVAASFQIASGGELLSQTPPNNGSGESEGQPPPKREKLPNNEPPKKEEKEKESVKDDPKQEPEKQSEAKTEKPKVPEEEKEKPQEEEKPEQASSAADVALQAIKDERERVAKIQAICNGEYNEIEHQAVSAGWTPEETSQRVLKALRENRPETGVNVTVKHRPQGALMRKALEAAMCIRIGISGDELISEYGEETVDRGYDAADMPMKQLLVECLNMEGVPAPSNFGNETIHAAFSTVSLPGILSNVANKKLLQSYNAQPIIATRLCSTGDLNDFKENDRFRLTDAGDLQPIGPDGEIKDGGLSEERATNQLDTYGKKFCLTRKMIINDDLGAFMKVPIAMGNRAARLIDQLFFRRLLKNPAQSDGDALFSEAHHNILSGAESVLAAEGLRRAVQSFLDQVDADGQPINIEPRFLLVPTGLKHTAIELTKGATLIIAGGDATSGTKPSIRPALNSLVDENLTVVSSPYLANSKYDGHSQNAWYLFGDPASVDTFEIGFLKGKRTPTVERGDTDYNTLGLWFRVYFDLGVREQDFRGMVKANGQ